MFNFIAIWRREREAVRELSRLTDRELADLGISRCDIGDVVEGARREVAPRAVRQGVDAMAPAWGAHARRSVTA